MNQLLWEILGWLGYLQRGPVVAQVLLIIGICVGWQQFKPRRGLQHLHPSLQLLVPPIAVLLIAWLIALPGGKTGLVTYAGLCWLGWNLLSLLQKLLLCFMPEFACCSLQLHVPGRK